MIASPIGLPLSSVINSASSSRMAFNQIGDLEQVAGALMRPHRMPFAALESLACGFYGFVHVGLVAFRNPAENFFIGRIDRLEGLAGFRGNPLAVDQKFLGRVFQKLAYCGRRSCRGAFD